ncbi:MAG: glutathione S-transferase family protein [bacterium]
MASVDEVVALKNLPVVDQPVPVMAPPFLINMQTDECLAQMPAIVMYLADKHDYLPEDAYRKSLVLKVLLDSNDLLSDLTNANGSKMWEHEQWGIFRSERLVRWMQMFEQTGIQFGLESDSGFLLGGSRATCADIAVTALFGTMTRCLKPLSQDLAANAPRIAALVARMESHSVIQRFFVDQEAVYENLYCGGQIEKSIRKMLAKDEK